MAAGAFVLASTAMTAAADDITAEGFTVTQNFFHEIPIAANNIRTGMGVNQKVYAFDKANGKIIEVSAEGVKTLDLDATGCNSLTCDDAGNIILKVGGFGDKGDKADHYRIYPAAGGEAVDVQLAENDGVSEFVGRSDQIGKAIGNVLGDEGGAFFVLANTTSYIRPVILANGEQNADYADYINSVLPDQAATSMSIAVPTKKTMEELLGLSDLYNEGAYYRSDANYQIQGIDEAGEAWVTDFVRPTNFNQHGWDIIYMGENEYQLVSGQRGGHWTCAWCIADKDGKILVNREVSDYTAALANGNGSMLNVRYVDENTVEVYQLYVTAAAGYAAMWTVKFPGGDEPQPAAPLYMWGNTDGLGWDSNAPAEMTYENGVYTWSFPANCKPSFKIGDAKGASWDEVNAAVYNVVEGNEMAGAGTYTLAKNDFAVNNNPSNLSLPNGTWNIKVDLANLTLTVEGEANLDAPTYYFRGEVNGWGFNEAYQLIPTGETSESGEIIYKLAFPEGLVAGQFKIADQTWGDVFSNGGSISDYGTYEFFHSNSTENTKLTKELKPAYLTFYYQPEAGKSSWLKIDKTDAVEDIAVDANEAEAVYYNFQGVRVQNVVPGAYIKVVGDKASKVIVR